MEVGTRSSTLKYNACILTQVKDDHFSKKQGFYLNSYGHKGLKDNFSVLKVHEVIDLFLFLDLRRDSGLHIGTLITIDIEFLFFSLFHLSREILESSFNEWSILRRVTELMRRGLLK